LFSLPYKRVREQFPLERILCHACNGKA
jgi:hypothetical protein